jgi:uncharacterized membrane-anchored protein
LWVKNSFASLSDSADNVATRKIKRCNMARKALRYFLLLALLTFALSAQEPQPRLNVDWQHGPTVGNLGGMAQIKVPAGYMFAGKSGAEEVLRFTKNLTNGEELGVLVKESDSWFMIFRYEDTGYVKDSDKDSLDADDLLKNIKEGTEAANEKRKSMGYPAFHVTGWERTPYYDPLTHNLTWAIRGRGDDPTDSGSINHSIKLLGRTGVIKVNLVTEPSQYGATVSEFNNLISGFSYVQGKRYSDFTKGDKIAEYGLAGLIAAGGAGLLIKFWKPIVVGIAALGAAIKKFFGRMFGGSKDASMQPPPQPPPPQAAAQG